MVGTMPWYALAFITMWLESSCFSHIEAANIVLAFNLGGAVGSAIGGIVVDSGRFNWKAAAHSHRDEPATALALG